MPELINQVKSVENLTTYDRSDGGRFRNAYNTNPSICFNMQRVTVRDRDGVIVSSEELKPITESYVAGKIYDLLDPTTGDKIGTFTSDQFYAQLYSMVVRCTSDAKAAALAALAADKATADKAAADKATAE